MFGRKLEVGNCQPLRQGFTVQLGLEHCIPLTGLNYSNSQSSYLFLFLDFSSALLAIFFSKLNFAYIHKKSKMFSKNEIPNKTPRIVYDLISHFTIIISFITFEYCYFISLPMNHFSAAAKKKQFLISLIRECLCTWIFSWSLSLIDYS